MFSTKADGISGTNIVTLCTYVLTSVRDACIQAIRLMDVGISRSHGDKSATDLSSNPSSLNPRSDKTNLLQGRGARTVLVQRELDKRLSVIRDKLPLRGVVLDEFF